MRRPGGSSWENGRAVGVETADGRRYRARYLVASSLNPQQTFLDLIDADVLPGAWRRKAEKFRYNLLAPLFALNLALDAPPAYAAAERYPELARPFMTVLGLDHVRQFDEIVRHHEAGTIPPTVMWGTCPTQFDAGQSARGTHAAFMWEKLPYALHGDPANWDAAKDAHGAAMLDLWADYAPGLRDSVVGSFTRSPLDIEREFPNMSAGDLLVGAFTDGQIGHHRPFEGAGDYRTCIEGPLSLRLVLASRWQHHRAAGLQRGADDLPRSRARRRLAAGAGRPAHRRTCGLNDPDDFGGFPEENGAGRHCQSSTARSGTRLNSPTFFVTSVASSAPRMGGDQQVVVADRPAEALQFASDRAVIPVRRLGQGERLDRREHGFELPCQACRPAAFRAVSQFGSDDNADGKCPRLKSRGPLRDRSVRPANQIGHDICVQHKQRSGHVRGGLPASPADRLSPGNPLPGERAASGLRPTATTVRPGP